MENKIKGTATGRGVFSAFQFLVFFSLNGLSKFYLTFDKRVARICEKIVMYGWRPMHPRLFTHFPLLLPFVYLRVINKTPPGFCFSFFHASF